MPDDSELPAAPAYVAGNVADALAQDMPTSPENVKSWVRSQYDASQYGPVSNWLEDFDHSDPAYNPAAPDIWAAAREAGCPVATTTRYGGMAVPLTHAAVREVSYDSSRFSSRTVVVSHSRPGDLALPAPIGIAPPITSDPPFHQQVRRLLLPAFSPKTIDALADDVTALCRRLLADLDDPLVDAAAQYAQHIPVGVIGRMLGFPDSDEELFREFVHMTLETATAPPAVRAAALEQLGEYIDAQLVAHEENPSDNLTSYLLSVKIDGEPIPRTQVAGMIVLLLVAGIDTTWSAIGSGLLHFATHPDDLRRYVTEPDVRDSAIEEILRYYAPVTMARLSTADTTIAGCPVAADDWVLLPFPAANRDPQMFEDADTFIIDRKDNRHAAFGLGIHRCLGSNLARLELRIALDEWVAKFPEFALRGPVTWSVGQVRGPRSVPVATTVP